jgi:hypothetical protein
MTRSKEVQKLNWGSSDELLRLRILGETLADAKKDRIATENRILRAGAAEWEMGIRLLSEKRAAEDLAGQHLMEMYQEVIPAQVRDWAASIPGLGSGELFARIMAIIGNPLVAYPHHWEEGARFPVIGESYERTLRQLYMWCGCGDPKRRPQLLSKPSRDQLLACGMRTTVRPLLHTFSAYLLRAHTRSDAVASSKYWAVFTEYKERGLKKKHSYQCQNKVRPPLSPNGCGTVAHPEWGEPGSPWRKGHAQANAHRVTQRELIHDLFHVAGGPQCDDREVRRALSLAAHG